MRNEKILKRLLFRYLKNKNIYEVYKYNRINHYDKMYDPHRTCFKIRRAFSWARTKEGHEFWNGIASDFEFKMERQQKRYPFLKIHKTNGTSIHEYIVRCEY